MDKKASFPYQGFAADQFNLGKNGDGYPMAPPPSYSAAPNATKPGSAGHNMGGGRGALASPPSAFYVKKWILLATIAFNFLGMFIALFYVDVILQMIIYRSEAIGKPLCDANLPCDEEMMSTFRAVAYVSLLVGLAFEGLFFYGVAAQHLCLVTGYTVLSILGALSMLLGCAVNPAKLIDTVVIAVLACVSYSYMKDLRAIRDRRIRLGLDVI